MRTLTLRQPWAWLVVNGHKDVENRTWRPAAHLPAAGPLLIHAGALRDAWAYGLASRIARRCDVELPPLDDLVRAAIVGVVDVVDITRDTSTSPWAEPGLFHWQLANARAFVEPRPRNGKQGLWESDVGFEPQGEDHVRTR